MTHPISKEQAVQLAREAGFDISISQGLKNPTPEVFAANVLVTSEIERICQAAYKQGRNAGLEEAVQMLQKTGATLPAKQEREGGNAVLTGVSISMAAIEYLKDKTP